MPKLHLRDGWRRLRVGVAVLAIATAAALTLWPSAAALECEGVALDDGCLFTITGGDTTDPNDGYAVTNAYGVPLWDFVRQRDLQAIGYPISQRWVNGPFTLQAFQKVILQWDPGNSRMNYYNTLDVLANRYPEVELPNVPPHQILAADRGANFATITQNHLALLDQNAAIKERFLSEPDWLNLYGLPISYEEREVNDHPQGLQMLRAQRTVFVIWNVPAPGTTVGRVNLQNVPDKAKKLSNVIIPDAAEAPVLADAVAYLPLFTLPAPVLADTPAPPPPLPLPPASDREALIRLYHATGGPNWTNNRNWLSDAPLGQWHGVITDPNGRVTRLELHRNQLRGPIPPEVGGLASLEVLWLHENQLEGAVPVDLGRLTKLRFLNLTFNQLSGMIPPALARLVNLEELDLGENQLRGAIPPDLGSLSKLTRLGLVLNQFSGQIPSELGNLGALQFLELGGNQLTGEIPPALGRLGNLQQLGLSSNQLAGAIPPELSQLTKLEKLTLHKNRLSGAIPSELGRLAKLERLGLSDNQLSEAVPAELGRLANLKFLDFSDNQLSGAIPSEFGRLGNLDRLWLTNNRLSGAIPPDLGRLTNLTHLDLSRNQLSGTIPPALSGLANLEEMWLHSNQLSGAIPSELGRLSKLKFLWLRKNQLSGIVPPELGGLSSLVRLALDQNQLHGVVPPELGKLANLDGLFLAGGNRFTGCIPERLRRVEANDLAQLGLPFC